tara:strand:+ start:25255 stop:26379 length:1125 start_codon:yes stop_codon:yes gene_type:complete
MQYIHIINDLKQGGTNYSIYRLIKKLDKDAKIISLYSKDYYYDIFKENGNEVYTIDLSSIKNFLKSLIKVIKILSREEEYILHCWLYKSCVFGVIFSLIYNKKIIWNIRHADTSFSFKKFKKYLIIRICIFLSKIKKTNIIYNSYFARLNHEKIGFNAKNTYVINNGFELNKYEFKIKDKLNFLKKYNIQNDKFIISMFARYHPIKNHKVFLESMSKIKNTQLNFHIFLAGRDINYKNKELMEQIKKYKLTDKITLAGILLEKELNDSYHASDLTILSSKSESFPNVIGEAMACNTPCITFDVGDCKKLIGDTGWIAYKKNSTTLAESINLAINLYHDKKKWTELKHRCRDRIKEFFNIKDEIKKYKNIYKKLN